MTNEQIAHDLTLLLIDSDDKTPKKLVDMVLVCEICMKYVY